MLLHYNCRVHKARQIQAIIAKRDFIELPHPPDSPDLAPCDFFLFKHLKKYFRGRKFAQMMTWKAQSRRFSKRKSIIIIIIFFLMKWKSWKNAGLMY